LRNKFGNIQSITFLAPFLSCDHRKERLFVIAGAVVFDEFGQGFVVLQSESLLDVLQVDLRPAHDYPDEGPIVGADPGHAVVQSHGQVLRSVAYRVHKRQERLLGGERELVLHHRLERVSRDVLVLGEDGPDLGAVPLAEHLVEGRLVGALDELSGPQQGLGVREGLLRVDRLGLVAVTLQVTVQTGEANRAGLTVDSETNRRLTVPEVSPLMSLSRDRWYTEKR
jgi:hypothetical protein